MLTRTTGQRASPIARTRTLWVAWCTPLFALLCMGTLCEPPPDCATYEGPYSVEVGMGVDSFRSLEDDEIVDSTFGSQGGSHLDGAARTENLFIPADLFAREDRMPRVTFQTLHGDELVGGYEDLPRPFVRDGTMGELLADPVIFMTDASLFWGQTLLLSIDVTDMCGHTAHDERRVILRDPGIEGDGS
jgi:hypothetical protein